VTYEIFFFSRFRLAWVMSKRVVDLFACWWSAGSTRSVWKMVSSCLLWCLWRKINDMSFEDREKTLDDYLWTTAIISPLELSFYDLLALFSPPS